MNDLLSNSWFVNIACTFIATALAFGGRTVWQAGKSYVLRERQADAGAAENIALDTQRTLLFGLSVMFYVLLCVVAGLGLLVLGIRHASTSLFWQYAPLIAVIFGGWACVRAINIFGMAARVLTRSRTTN